MLVELLPATHITHTHLFLEKWTEDPSLTALHRNVAIAKRFTSGGLTESFLYMEE